MLALKDIANLTGMGVPFLRLEMARGKLPYLKLGGRILVTVDQFQDYLNNARWGKK